MVDGETHWRTPKNPELKRIAVWSPTMNDQIIPALGHIDTTDRTDIQATRMARLAAASKPAMAQEVLPFTVRLVRDEKDLSKAVDIRQSAYARHLPEFAETLRVPESTDAQDGVVVLLAESKLDGSALGTMRIQTNRFSPLSLEHSVDLPDWLRVRPLAEAARLGVTDGKSGRLVKTMLFKAFFQYCQQTGIEWMVIAGRSPIDRQYERLLFSDAVPGIGYVPLLHANNLPHRIMSFEVGSAQRRWAEANHPLYDFIFRTNHPDLQLGDRSTARLPDTSNVNFIAAPAMTM
jgi:hypothetical protein